MIRISIDVWFKLHAYTKCTESNFYPRSKIDPSSRQESDPLSICARRDFRCVLYTQTCVHIHSLEDAFQPYRPPAGLSFCPRSSVNTMINMRHLAFHQTNVSPSFKTSFLSGLARAHTGISIPPVFIPLPILAINSISCLLNVQHAARAVPNFY